MSRDKLIECLKQCVGKHSFRNVIENGVYNLTIEFYTWDIEKGVRIIELIEKSDREIDIKLSVIHSLRKVIDYMRDQDDPTAETLQKKYFSMCGEIEALSDINAILTVYG